MEKNPFTFLALILFSFTVQAQSIFATRGMLDLRNYQFKDDAPLKLNGEWELYMMQLISPEELDQDFPIPMDYAEFPSTWNEGSQSSNPGEGYATYHLQLLIHSPQKLALDLPHFYSSYSLWIDGKNIAKNGIVGTSREKSKPQWLPQTIVFNAGKDTVDIVIQISNFYHALGGVREPLTLGDPGKLLGKRTTAIASNVALCCVLLVLAAAFILVYLFFRQDPAALYFAALVFTWALREGFSNLYIVTALVPDIPWEIAVRIEYLTLYLTMIWALLLLGSLFKNDVNNLFRYFFIACNIAFLTMTLFSDASFYTRFIPVYLSFAGMLLLYIVYVLIRAVAREREGAWLTVACMMLGVIVFSYDIIAYEGLMEFNSLITYIGYMGMFLFLGVTLAFQMGIFRRQAGKGDILTYEDLYGTK